MPITNNPDAALHVLIAIFIIFAAILLFYGLAIFLNDFSRELRYLNNEIKRTSGKEREHWLRRRRRLWLSLLPFVKY